MEAMTRGILRTSQGADKEVLYYHEIFRDLVPWLRVGGIVRLLYRIPMSREKTL
jgi:hypothetical protein